MAHDLRRVPFGLQAVRDRRSATFFGRWVGKLAPSVQRSFGMTTQNDREHRSAVGSLSEVDSSSTERWEIDTASSTLTFNLRHMVIGQIRGRFAHWGGALFLDRRQAWLSSVSVWVDVASIDTDDLERDDQIRSDEFLEVGRFARAEFKSTGVELCGAEVVLEGLLDLHGVVHDAEIRLTIGPSSTGLDGRERSSYTARCTIDRQSFGLHWNQDLDIGGVVVGDDVEIVAKLELVRVDTRAEPAMAPQPGPAG